MKKILVTLEFKVTNKVTPSMVKSAMEDVMMDDVTQLIFMDRHGITLRNFVVKKARDGPEHK